MKYKVGDEVALIGEVMEVDENDQKLPYRVCLYCGMSVWMAERDVLTLPAEPKTDPHEGLRPVEYMTNEGWKRGWFHCFSGCDAIIETEDGQITMRGVYGGFRFTDVPHAQEDES